MKSPLRGLKWRFAPKWPAAPAEVELKRLKRLKRLKG